MWQSRIIYVIRLLKGPVDGNISWSVYIDLSYSIFKANEVIPFANTKPLWLILEYNRPKEMDLYLEIMSSEDISHSRVKQNFAATVKHYIAEGLGSSSGVQQRQRQT